jgi:hypothetical protein
LFTTYNYSGNKVSGTRQITHGWKKYLSYTRLDSDRVRMPPTDKKSSLYPSGLPDEYRVLVSELSSLGRGHEEIRRGFIPIVLFFLIEEEGDLGASSISSRPGSPPAATGCYKWLSELMFLGVSQGVFVVEPIWAR